MPLACVPVHPRSEWTHTHYGGGLEHRLRCPGLVCPTDLFIDSTPAMHWGNIVMNVFMLIVMSGINSHRSVGRGVLTPNTVYFNLGH